ncbi:MAG: hypothetical protein HPY89_09315 [Pelotomaculum sp.]|nr:hypothetical protein [Pelotomaculum sp.]
MKIKYIIIPVVFLALSVVFIPWLQPGVDAAPNHKAVFVIGQETYIADGVARAMDVAPFVHDGRSYVPARFLGNALGIPDKNITWDSATQSATLSLNGAALRLTAGSFSLYSGERELTMDVAPVLREGRMFLPAYWVANALGYEAKWDEAEQAVLIGPPGDLPEPPAGLDELPSVGTYENLISLLEKAQGRSSVQYRMKSLDAAAAPELGQAGVPAPSGTGAVDYSRTNVQVEGVDEADIVKTDGSYIYAVSGDRIVIAKAYPAEEMKVVSVLNFAEKEFSPLEMYVDERYLVVIGHACKYPEDPVFRPMVEGNVKKVSRMMPPYYRDMVRAVIYDISDKSNVSQVRELELDGTYVSSRKIGPAFYLVADKSIYYHPDKESEDLRPSCRDTAIGNELVKIDCSEIKCFPGFVVPNYLIVAGLNLDRPEDKANINTYLGSGENIYCSVKNLYVAVTDYGTGQAEIDLSSEEKPMDGEAQPGIWPRPRPAVNKTRVYRFAMNDGKLAYSGSGEVPGTILNQFSMDEHNGYFRIATTKGEIWRTDEHTSKNNVYILDGNLNITGKIEDIAPGEKIYSVRFMGDRAYMVTFKTVDPFYVIDLKDPRRPAILGALKIPGYSDYLHPYDENHIIGFGKDTVELGQKGGQADGSGSMAFYTGMKMAIFDVSDLNNPVEMFREIIGDRGTDSELLHNHKALLFSREKGLLAFPVRLMEVKDGSKVLETGFPQYGEFVFQGAYVYNMNLVDGFNLRGKITHLSDQDYLKAGYYWYYSAKNVERIIYINDTLYTISKKIIKANSLGDLREIKTIEIS